MILGPGARIDRKSVYGTVLGYVGVEESLTVVVGKALPPMGYG